MRILFIFTGGTIGCTSGEDCISPDRLKTSALIEAYEKKYGIIGEYDVATPYYALSENNTGRQLGMAAEAVLDGISKGYDGIVLTHGTDTLQYTAAALSYVLGNDCAPVCIVSANYPVDDERSNGIDNLHGAITIIRNSCKGVFVPYRNADEPVKIHRASRLLMSRAFSDEVMSVGGKHYGIVDADGFRANPDYSEKSDELTPFGAVTLSERADSILRLFPFVGMSYPEIDNDVKCIITESYHSGTINTDSEDASRFFERASELGIPVFVAGAADGKTYESTLKFREWGCIPVPDIAPVALYIKLWLAHEKGMEFSKIVGMSLGGDIFT